MATCTKLEEETGQMCGADGAEWFEFLRIHLGEAQPAEGLMPIGMYLCSDHRPGAEAS